jgi:hypothetical protein
VSGASKGLILAVALGVAGCGSDEPESGKDAFSAVERGAAETGRGKKSAPRWEPIATLRGRGTGSRRLRVSDRALQWRVRWLCRGDRLELAVDGRRLARSTCPRRGRTSSIRTGDLRIEARGSGPWSLVVEQQVDSPLREPPLPDMRSALARGRFYAIERRGEGTALLYRLPSGRLALRFESFDTSANSDLFVWISRDPRPRNTKQALDSTHREIALLKSTLGDQNYVLPPGTTTADVRSVVIWCEPIQIAYTAASLSG